MTFWTGSGNRLSSSSDEEIQMMSLDTPTVTTRVSHIWDTRGKCSCGSEACVLPAGGSLPERTRLVAGQRE